MNIIMRILLLTHSFNSLTQRVFLELSAARHDVSVEFDVHDDVSVEAVRLFKPDVVVAPYLRRKIPPQIFEQLPTLVVHPGIPGDGGPSALDWAILEGQTSWGVTVLQANENLDGGDVWSTRSFPMRNAAKASMYRCEVTAAAAAAVMEAIGNVGQTSFRPTPLRDLDPATRGRWHPLVSPELRAIDWQRDTTETVLRNVHAADSFPGVAAAIGPHTFRLYGARCGKTSGGAPGQVIARSDEAVCLATIDGSVWISHLRAGVQSTHRYSIKLPAWQVLQSGHSPVHLLENDAEREEIAPIRYDEQGLVGHIDWDILNGAMSTRMCEKLRAHVEQAGRRKTRVLVLWGGREFFCNGLDLNAIEASDHPAEESWQNILAMNALVRQIVTTTSHLVVVAVRGNAGAGGAYLALAADRVYLRKGVVLNMHYKNMGNLHGSEYWTYLLPRRTSAEGVEFIRNRRLPLHWDDATRLHLADDVLSASHDDFEREVRQLAQDLANRHDFDALLKNKRRQLDDAACSLDAYAEGELRHMKENFFGFDPSYHVARYNFVHKIPHSRTPLYLAKHRDGSLAHA